MEISLQRLRKSDAENLMAFERDNRLFFEQMVPSRGDDYYEWDKFLKRHQALLDEQQSGHSRFYLIKDKDANIVGRMNVTDIEKNAAEVGFRMGESYVGKGLGKKALTLLLSQDPDIKRYYAKTTTVNKASQKVLENNGFVEMETSIDEFELNGQKMRFIHYVWDKKNDPS